MANLTTQEARHVPKWLQGMVRPTLTLWFCVFAVATAIVLTDDQESLPWRAELASRVSLSLVMASWIMADARKRGRELCYDFDSLLFFAWPVVAPVYLFQTRGARAFLTLLCFFGVVLIASVAATAVVIIQGFLPP